MVEAVYPPGYDARQGDGGQAEDRHGNHKQDVHQLAHCGHDRPGDCRDGESTARTASTAVPGPPPLP